MIIIHPDDENVLDLYDVDYVCKVTFVEGDYIIEKLEGSADVQDKGE